MLIQLYMHNSNPYSRVWMVGRPMFWLVLGIFLKLWTWLSQSYKRLSNLRFLLHPSNVWDILGKLSKLWTDCIYDRQQAVLLKGVAGFGRPKIRCVKSKGFSIIETLYRPIPRVELGERRAPQEEAQVNEKKAKESVNCANRLYSCKAEQQG